MEPSTPRDEVQTHPLVDMVFSFTSVECWRKHADLFIEEMPKLMHVILERCSNATPVSASAVYYYLRDSREPTALDLIQAKQHKIITLSRLMMRMSEAGMLCQTRREDSVHQGGRGRYFGFRTAEELWVERDSA